MIQDMLDPADLIGNLIWIFGIWFDDAVQQMYAFEQEYRDDYIVHLHPLIYSSRFSDTKIYPFFNALAYPTEYHAACYSKMFIYNYWKIAALFYDY